MRLSGRLLSITPRKYPVQNGPMDDEGVKKEPRKKGNKWLIV